MGWNVMGDVIPGCPDAPGGDVAASWWEKRWKGNMERLTGREWEDRQPVEETEIQSLQNTGGRGNTGVFM